MTIKHQSRQMRLTEKWQPSAILLSVLTLWNQVTAYGRNSDEKPTLPPLVFVTPMDVAGNAQTKAIEQKIINLMKRAPRPKSGEPSTYVSHKISTEQRKLIDQITDAEQLTRLAHWSIAMEKGPLPDSDLDLIHSAFLDSLVALKERFPLQARSRIYEIAAFIRGQEAASLDIDAILERFTEDPNERAGCNLNSCMVYAGGNVEESALSFNMTRFLRQKWYPNWTGKNRYWVDCSFILMPSGQIRQLKTESHECLAGSTPKLIQDGVKKATVILTTAPPFASIPKPERPTKLRVTFSD